MMSEEAWLKEYNLDQEEEGSWEWRKCRIVSVQIPLQTKQI
jgi:hypothetical protein